VCCVLCAIMRSACGGNAAYMRCRGAEGRAQDATAYGLRRRRTTPFLVRVRGPAVRLAILYTLNLKPFIRFDMG
jgi:hypothetical protein